MDNCFDCKHIKQGKSCMHCAHQNAVHYMVIKVKEQCFKCGRQPGVNKGGCGACIGRGQYCYPNVYDECDCNGFEPKKAVA